MAKLPKLTVCVRTGAARRKLRSLKALARATRQEIDRARGAAKKLRKIKGQA